MAITQVKTPGIADDAVTLAKQAAGTDGQIITYDASGNPTAVGPGTDGQVLTSTGAGSPPAFEALPASNNYVHPNHSGEVTSTADGATVIASNIVDEDNLKISNAGSNGQYLQKQSGNTGGLTWADVTSSDTLPFRNLIINGAMTVSQRGTVANAGNEYGGPDRMFFFKNDGAMTISKDTSDFPTGQGFAASWKCDVTSVAGTSGSYYVGLQQKIEGQNLQRIKKGTANAEQLTLSFWIKSTKTGTYIAELWDEDNNRTCSKSYTVSSSNTWEKKEITFPADTTGTLGNDNGDSFRVYLWFFAGSSFSSGTLNTTWASNTNANRAVGQVNACDNTSNNVYITGLQLEIGATATAFEFSDYARELQRCQRYYLNLDMFYSSCITYTPGSGDHTFSKMNCTYPTTMRSNPSGVAGDFAIWSWSSASGVSASDCTWSFDNGVNNAMLTMSASHGDAAAPANGPGSGHMMPCRALNIKFNSEL